MRGRIREDYTTNTKKTPNGCGEWDKKGANRLKKGEGSGWKLKKLGMMGRWMEAKAHMGIGVKLTTGIRY